MRTRHGVAHHLDAIDGRQPGAALTRLTQQLLLAAPGTIGGNIHLLQIMAGSGFIAQFQLVAGKLQ